MWISSQDKKTLIDAYHFSIVELNYHVYTIVVQEYNRETYSIGDYSSEEKAMEVLGRIRTFLRKGPEIATYYNERSYKSQNIFQMPKDEEV